MVNNNLKRSDVQNELKSIINDVSGVSIDKFDDCLFNEKYNISSELFVYILLNASKKFDFDINDSLFDSFTNYSFNNVVDSIMNHISDSAANNDIISFCWVYT